MLLEVGTLVALGVKAENAMSVVCVRLKKVGKMFRLSSYNGQSGILLKPDTSAAKN